MGADHGCIGISPSMIVTLQAVSTTYTAWTWAWKGLYQRLRQGFWYAVAPRRSSGGNFETQALHFLAYWSQDIACSYIALRLCLDTRGHVRLNDFRLETVFMLSFIHYFFSLKKCKKTFFWGGLGRWRGIFFCSMRVGCFKTTCSSKLDFRTQFLSICKTLRRLRPPFVEGVGVRINIFLRFM